MIYSNQGEPMNIIGSIGEHKYRHLITPVTIVQVRYDDGETRYRIAQLLRADNGIAEIDNAVNSVPVLVLSESERKHAIREAM